MPTHKPKAQQNVLHFVCRNNLACKNSFAFSVAGFFYTAVIYTGWLSRTLANPAQLMGVLEVGTSFSVYRCETLCILIVMAKSERSIHSGILLQAGSLNSIMSGSVDILPILVSSKKKNSISQLPLRISKSKSLSSKRLNMHLKSAVEHVLKLCLIFMGVNRARDPWAYGT